MSKMAQIYPNSQTFSSGLDMLISMCQKPANHPNWFKLRNSQLQCWQKPRWKQQK